MLFSLGLVFLIGPAAAALCRKLKLPPVIGMLAVGIALGPYAANLMDDAVLAISAELRQIALVIILIRAGLSLRLEDLKKVGRPALMLSFVPAVFEIAAFIAFAPFLLGVTRLEAAIMGAVIGAVSPAVVVPKMVALMESGYGVEKRIPQLILAGASLDDVFVIVLFSTFISMAQNGSAAPMTALVQIPSSILLGLASGALIGWLLAKIFETAHEKRRTIRNSLKVILILGCAFLLVAAEKILESQIRVSGLLAVTSMACTLNIRCAGGVPKRLSEKFGKLWLAAQVLLFVLVGAAVDIRYTLAAGPRALGMLALGLAFRCAGVWLCLVKTPLNRRERLFCMIAYLPKATVQAAIGSVALSLGLPCGQIVLSVAVLAILTTAPLGAIGMDLTDKKLLEKMRLHPPTPGGAA